MQVFPPRSNGIPPPGANTGAAPLPGGGSFFLLRCRCRQSGDLVPSPSGQDQRATQAKVWALEESARR